jgi:hypothetical protein
MENSDDVTFPYKGRLGPGFFAVIGFAGFTCATVYAALTNDQAFSLLRFFKFGVGLTTAVLWGFAALFMYVTLLSLFAVLRSMGSPRYVRLSSDGLTAPKSVASGETVSVKFADVLEAQARMIGKAEVFEVVHRHGKLLIPRATMKSEAAFLELMSLVRDRIAKAGRG